MARVLRRFTTLLVWRIGCKVPTPFPLWPPPFDTVAVQAFVTMPDVRKCRGLTFEIGVRSVGRMCGTQLARVSLLSLWALGLRES